MSISPRPLRPHRYDVVVVGARVAGASTAMLLARRGLRVLVIDRAGYGSDVLSTHALMRGGVVQLQRWGLLDAVIDAGTPPVEGVTFHYDDTSVRVELRPGGELYAPRRTVLDPILVDAAKDAGADVLYGPRVVDLDRRADGQVTGVVVEQDRAVTRIAAQLVIGADGIRSTVARLADAPVVRRGTGAAASVYGYVRGLEDHDYHWHFTVGAASGAIPTNDGETCVFAGIPASRFDQELRPDVTGGFWRILRHASPDLAASAARRGLATRLRSFPGLPGFFRRAHGPGWALVGDAGHYNDPATAHGITGALRDAELLADAVIDDDLQGYEDARDDLSDAIFTATDRIASYPWDLDQVRQAHLDLSQAFKREARSFRPDPPSDHPAPARNGVGGADSCSTEPPRGGVGPRSVPTLSSCDRPIGVAS